MFVSAVLQSFAILIELSVFKKGTFLRRIVYVGLNGVTLRQSPQCLLHSAGIQISRISSIFPWIEVRQVGIPLQLSYGIISV